MFDFAGISSYQDNSFLQMSPKNEEIALMNRWLDEWYAARDAEAMYMPMMREQAGLWQTEHVLVSVKQPNQQGRAA